MADSRKTIDNLNGEISQFKSQISRNEGQMLQQLGKSNSPVRVLRTQTDRTFQSPELSKVIHNTFDSPSNNEKELVSYIENMKKLNNSLEEKSFVVEVDHQKKKINFQNTIKSLQNEIQILSQDLNHKQNIIQSNSSKLKQLESILSDKDKEIRQLTQELAHYRKQSVGLKQDNKKYKADNKIIMNQIDRLTKDTITPEQKVKLMQNREMRVIKSLYQDVLPMEQPREEERRVENTKQIVQKGKVHYLQDQNGQLKALIRRLNQQIQILKAEKALLVQENKQKTINLDNQRQIAQIAQESNIKLNSLIQKMGDKTMSLQQINQTLRQNQSNKQQLGTYSEDYYMKTRSKVGQFYYKR